MKKINVLITAAGTGAGWYLTKTAKEIFPDIFQITITDTNPIYLVSAATFADKFYQVPPLNQPDYEQTFKQIMLSNDIDVFIPIIDLEVTKYVSDLPWFIQHHIVANTIPQSTAQYFSNKKILYNFLNQHSLAIPRMYQETSDIKANQTYFSKPINGYGSKGARQINSKQAKQDLKNKQLLVQELCDPPELTIEVFNFQGKQYIACRERLETKAGVCTKAKIFFDEELLQITQQLCTIMTLPSAFCFQVMKNQRQQWVITDINPRLGAGTSMSSAAGFNLTAALLSTFIPNGPNPTKFLKSPTNDQYVTRVYQDIVTKVINN